jgi:hypothetical protein
MPTVNPILTLDPKLTQVLAGVTRFQVASTKPHADKNQSALQTFVQASLTSLQTLVTLDVVTKNQSLLKFIQTCIAGASTTK